MKWKQVFVTIEAIGSVNATPYVTGPSQEKFEDSGIITLSSVGAKIKAFGLSGDYLIRIGPSKSDPFYRQARYAVHVPITFRPCLPAQGYNLVEDLSCQEIKCPGCQIEKGATCVSPGNCSCPSTNGARKGLEGLQCELVEDAYDSISLKLPSLPSLVATTSRKRDVGGISVPMRDFLLSNLQNAYVQANMSVVVKYRKFYEEGGLFVLKYSLLDAEGQYIEGEDLAGYEDVAKEYILRVFGIQFESELIVVEAYYLEFDDPLVIVVLVISVILILIAIIFFILVVVNRNTPVIKSSSPTFNMFILVGIILAYLTFFPYVGKPTKYSCMTPVGIAPLAFAISFGNLFAKTFRIYRIFTNRKMRRVAPSDWQLLGISGVIIFIELILIAAWLGADPPVPVRRGGEANRYYTCSSPLGTTMTSVILAYNGVLLVFGTYLAIMTRKAFSAYKESQMIGFSIYSLLIVALAVLPVLYFTDLDLPIQFAIRSFAVIFVTSATMFLLFGTKMFIIVLRPQQNTTEFLKRQDNGSSTSGMNLRPTSKSQNGTNISAAGSGSLLDVASAPGDELNRAGWVLLNETKPWSQWKKVYAVRHGDYFGFFDNEEGVKGGLSPLHRYIIERVETETGPQLKIELGRKVWMMDANHQDDLERWMEVLALPSKPSRNTENRGTLKR